MNKITCISTLALAFLLNVATAETDLLNLSAYSEGEAPSYGDNLIVAKNDKTGEKWLITKGDSGNLSFPINLSGEFEVIIKVKIPSSFNDRTLSLQADGYLIQLYFDMSGMEQLKAGIYSVSGNDEEFWRTEKTNELRLSVNGPVAKLYVNGVFSKKIITLEPDLTYTQLFLTDWQNKDQLHELKVSSSDAQSPECENDDENDDFETGKQAGIQQCVDDPASCGISVSSNGAHATYNSSAGEVHIPFLDVLGPFGGTQTYDIFLIQQPLTFTFDLDEDRIELR